VLKAAGVTDDQKAQIKAIAAAHRPRLRDLHSQVRAAHEKLSDALFTGGDPTPTMEQITTIRGELLVEAVRMRQAMLGVLTAEQLGKVAQLQDQLRALRAERHKLLMGGMPGAQ
jgi:Spy/CpxP family protein refolding chaperone